MIGATIRNAAGTIIGENVKGVVDTSVNRGALLDRVQLIREAGEQPCVTAVSGDDTSAPRFCTNPHPATPIDGPYLPYSGAVLVSCSPRSAIAYGRFPDGEPVPSVVLDGGQTVRARRIRLPYLDAWVAPLPDTTVLGLRVGKHRATLRIPPAGQQCGYSVARYF